MVASAVILGAGCAADRPEETPPPAAASPAGQAPLAAPTAPPEDCDVGAILAALEDRYAAEHGITVEPAEIDELARSIAQANAEDGEFRDICRRLILIEKVSAAVYREYGGAVSYHLLPPVYPVEAFERLVEASIAQGALVLDDHCRAALRDSFAAHDRVPAAPDAFSTPWWLNTGAACCPAPDAPPQTAGGGGS